MDTGRERGLMGYFEDEAWQGALLKHTSPLPSKKGFPGYADQSMGNPGSWLRSSSQVGTWDRLVSKAMSGGSGGGGNLHEPDIMVPSGEVNVSMCGRGVSGIGDMRH